MEAGYVRKTGMGADRGDGVMFPCEFFWASMKYVSAFIIIDVKVFLSVSLN